MLGSGYALRSGTTVQRCLARDSIASSNVPFQQQSEILEENVLPSIDETIEENIDEVQEDETLPTTSRELSLVPKPLDHPPIFGKDI